MDNVMESIAEKVRFAIGSADPVEKTNETLQLINRIGIKRYNVMMNSQFAHGTQPRKWKHVGGRKRISAVMRCTKGLIGASTKRSRRSNRS